jgi:hypothetical protein
MYQERNAERKYLLIQRSFGDGRCRPPAAVTATCHRCPLVGRFVAELRTRREYFTYGQKPGALVRDSMRKS